MAEDSRPDEATAGDDEDSVPDRAAGSDDRTRGQRFHEATGSLRDLGIAILILILLYVVVYFAFIR